MTLTACLIVRNESARITRCLRSIVQHVDRVVILDTGSTDDTVTIARRMGADVTEEPWRTVDIGGGYQCLGDFAAARNRCFELAEGASWYLVVDADHVYVPPTFVAIRQCMAKPDVHAAALRYHIASSTTARPADVVTGAKRIAQPFNSAALFRADLQPRYEGVIHETTTRWFRECEAYGTRQVVLADSRIADYGHDPRIRATLGKDERNERMLRHAIKLDPSDPIPYTYLASDLIGGQRHAECLPLIEACWSKVGNDDRLLGSHLLRLCVSRGLVAHAMGNPYMVWDSAVTWDRIDGRPHPDIDLLKGLACELWGHDGGRPLKSGGIASPRQCYVEACAFYRTSSNRSADAVGSQIILNGVALERIAELEPLIQRGEPMVVL